MDHDMSTWPLRSRNMLPLTPAEFSSRMSVTSRVWCTGTKNETVVLLPLEDRLSLMGVTTTGGLGFGFGRGGVVVVVGFGPDRVVVVVVGGGAAVVVVVAPPLDGGAVV